MRDTRPKRRHPPTTSHNYVEKVLALGLTLRPGTLRHIDIRHDDWCDGLKGGYCNCDPDVSLRSQTGDRHSHLN